MEFDYNTQRKKLIQPEYGRNIQIMVDHLLTIKDRAERTRAAKTVIDVMGNLYPHLRDVPDFRHKLWDHLAIMANFQLDIDAPYPLPSIQKLQEKPSKLAYSNNRIRFRHYGKLTEKLIEAIRNEQDPDKRKALIVLTANHMKKSFLTWNKDTVEDEQIYKDINTLYGSELVLPEGMMLSASKDLLQKKIKPVINKPVNKQFQKKNNNKQFHKKQQNQQKPQQPKPQNKNNAPAPK